MAYGAKNQDQIVKAIADLRIFKIGNMKGSWYPSSEAVPTGKLAPEHTQALRYAGAGQRPVYVIFSYATPIAWRTAGDQGECQWCHPVARYSITTSGHQSLAAQGMQAWEDKIMSLIGEPQR